MIKVKGIETISIDQVMVRSTKDRRKSVRVPAKLYDEVMKNRKFGEKNVLFDKIINKFYEEFKQNSDIIKFDGSNIKIVKISEETYKIIKLIKFQTDKSNTDIIASAIVKYLSK